MIPVVEFTQIWTNVKKNLITATLMPAVITPWAHLNASVAMDSPGTVVYAQVLKSHYPNDLAVRAVRGCQWLGQMQCGCSISIYIISEIILAF